VAGLFTKNILVGSLRSSPPPPPPTLSGNSLSNLELENELIFSILSNRRRGSRSTIRFGCFYVGTVSEINLYLTRVVS